MKNKFRRKIVMVPVFVIAMFFAVTAIVMVLWNHILPDILGVKAVTFWQAMGILVLSKILFGGFHGKAGFARDKFRRIKEERMHGMTDEQKEKLKEVWKQRCERGFFRDKF